MIPQKRSKTVKCAYMYCYRRVKIPAKSPFCSKCELRNKETWGVKLKKK